LSFAFEETARENRERTGRERFCAFERAAT